MSGNSSRALLPDVLRLLRTVTEGERDCVVGAYLGVADEGVP